MTDHLSIAIAQINPIVGDIAGNLALIRAAWAKGAAEGADLVVCPELALVGYPAEDLVLKPAFQRAVAAALEELREESKNWDSALLFGSILRETNGLFVALHLVDNGEIIATRRKHHLPNYGVFDELRVFTPGEKPTPFQFRGVRIGAMICEDFWYDDVAAALKKAGAEIFICISASPYQIDKIDERQALGARHTARHGVPVLFANQVGGQDELAFDGSSYVLNGDGSRAAQLPAWRQDTSITHWKKDKKTGWSCISGPQAEIQTGNPAIYRAMVLGLRDYVQKNRFPGLILGLSGGVDSALSAVIAVDALGPEKVKALLMPSPYTHKTSLEDALKLAETLSIDVETVPIEPGMEVFDHMLEQVFHNKARDETEENIQARIRGMLLMAYSNKFGHMVLTTGNKSEMSVGYATLYGDMCGGYSVLKDVYKTKVFELSRWRNAHLPEDAMGPEGEVIPCRTITRPPTAELRPDQKDEDSLPPYEILDAILEGLIEQELSNRDIVAKGYDAEMVARIESLLYIAEYKRRQAPPGVKITSKSFGRDRRYPITNGFRDTRKLGHEFHSLSPGASPEEKNK